MTRNQIDFARQQEDKRHNLLAERQKEREIAIGQISALSAQEQARVAGLRQSEDARHNRAGEALNWFSETSKIGETNRHNLASEALTARDIAQRERSVSEAARHNVATERLQSQTLAESILHNRNTEAIGRTQAGASVLQAQASGLQAQASLSQALTAERNAATRESELSESIRHNMVGEEFTSRDVTSREKQASASITQAAASATRAQAAAVSAQAQALDASTKRTQSIFTSAESASRTLTNLGGLARSILLGG